MHLLDDWNVLVAIPILQKSIEEKVMKFFVLLGDVGKHAPKIQMANAIVHQNHL